MGSIYLYAFRSVHELLTSMAKFLRQKWERKGNGTWALFFLTRRCCWFWTDASVVHFCSTDTGGGRARRSAHWPGRSVNIIKTMEENLKLWNNWPHSHMGRICTIKMNIRPKINYLLPITLVQPNTIWFSTLDSETAPDKTDRCKKRHQTPHSSLSVSRLTGKLCPSNV